MELARVQEIFLFEPGKGYADIRRNKEGWPPSDQNGSLLLSAVGKSIYRAVPWPQFIMTVVDLTASPIVITLLFALVFKMLPEGDIAWRRKLPAI